MAARHDALAAAFAREPPSWVGLAKFFADAGMKTAEGVPPTPASVRATWLRVHAQANRQREAAATSPAPAPLPAQQSSPASNQESPSASVSDGSAGDDDGYHFDFGEPVR
jgi:hypothetical protein